jgi:hypothetical protein
MELRVDVPDEVLPEFERLQRVGVKPLTPRRSAKLGQEAP